MKPDIYIETSVISYLTARPSRDVLTAARQTWTREWWAVAHDHWRLNVSELVVEEAERGDLEAARLRIAALTGLNVMPVSIEAPRFAQQLIDAGAMPATESEDALHIALATVSGARYLVSWNFAHLVGPDAKVKLLDAVRALNQTPALLATPEELLEVLK
jgi:predicted nucleic acid-binding protein